MVFRSEGDIPDRNRRPAPLSELPAGLLDGIHAVATVGSDRQKGNLTETGAPGTRPAPLTVAMNRRRPEISTHSTTR